MQYPSQNSKISNYIVKIVFLGEPGVKDIELPDFANKNTENQVKYEFQIKTKSFKYKNIPKKYFGYIYTKNIFVIYLELKFNSCPVVYLQPL